MSIQINGIDKPKSCFDCPCIDAEFEECAAREHYLLPKDEYGAVLGEVPDWCPITELPTCEDAVSRHAAIDALAKFVPYVIDDVSTESYTNGLTDAYNLICQLPSAQPERKWTPCSNPPKHHKDVIVRGIEAIGNVTVHKVMQWDVDTWRPTDYAPSVMWKEWSEI